MGLHESTMNLLIVGKHPAFKLEVPRESMNDPWKHHRCTMEAQKHHGGAPERHGSNMEAP